MREYFLIIVLCSSRTDCPSHRPDVNFFCNAWARLQSSSRGQKSSHSVTGWLGRRLAGWLVGRRAGWLNLFRHTYTQTYISLRSTGPAGPARHQGAGPERLGAEPMRCHFVFCAYVYIFVYSLYDLMYMYFLYVHSYSIVIRLYNCSQECGTFLVSLFVVEFYVRDNFNK